MYRSCCNCCQLFYFFIIFFWHMHRSSLFLSFCSICLFGFCLFGFSGTCTDLAATVAHLSFFLPFSSSCSGHVQVLLQLFLVFYSSFVFLFLPFFTIASTSHFFIFSVLHFTVITYLNPAFKDRSMFCACSWELGHHFVTRT